MSIVKLFKGVGDRELPKPIKKAKSTRESRAHEIVFRHKHAMMFKLPPIIVQTTKNTIGVASTSRDEHSSLEYKFGKWLCDCPDARMRGVLCKHNIAIAYCKLNGVKIPTIDEAMEMSYD